MGVKKKIDMDSFVFFIATMTASMLRSLEMKIMTEKLESLTKENTELRQRLVYVEDLLDDAWYDGMRECSHKNCKDRIRPDKEFIKGNRFCKMCITCRTKEKKMKDDRKKKSINGGV